MKRVLILAIVLIFLSGCGGLFWVLSQKGGRYGLNEDGSCSEGCIKVYWEEGDEDMAYCDCTNQGD